MKEIISFSGGKDSTAMLLLMLEKKMRIDDVVFFDTGWEFPAMYEHIKKVEKHIGFEITFVYSKQTFDFYFKKYRKMKGNNKDKIGLSWADFKCRWCTRYKINAIKKYCNSLGEHIIYEGIAFDEPKRFKEGKKYPLVDFGYTEKMALEYCYSKGFDWAGLYENFRRVSCYCCPLKSIPELRALYNKYPDLWKKMIEMDKNTWRKFRPDYSLQELGAKFYNENLQTKLEF